MKIRTALAVMCRVPRAGEGKTRLAGVVPPDRLVALQAAMLADTIGALGRITADERYLFVAPLAGGDEASTRVAIAPHAPDGWRVGVQTGSDLGARLEQVFSRLLAPGPARVLITGSDAPFLSLAGLDLAALQEEEAVLLPTEDGGYAAIALGRSEPRLFRDMTWSTSSVAAETRRRARLAGLRLRELPSTFDVDEPADLERLRRTLHEHPEWAPRTAAALR